MREYKHAVFIGRFQPFHKGHEQVLKRALEIADKVIVLIGSCNVSSDIKNPFTFDERVEMIKECLDDSVKKSFMNGTRITTTYLEGDNLSRLIFIPIRDYYYNDNIWVTEVLNKTSQHIKSNETVALMGNYKDASSYYLNLFPQWELVTVEQKAPIHATTVREKLYQRDEKVMDFNPYHPDNALNSLKNLDYLTLIPTKINNWMVKNYFLKEKYHTHVQEYQYIQGYKKQWEGVPFPPTFNTVDSVVVCSGHVLVIERGFNPGKGKLALPGGFLRQTERIEDGALRELKEETGIEVQKLILKSSIVNSKVFDYPQRSLRGRTITHAFYIRLKDGELPKVIADDDASKVFWMPLNEVYQREAEFFEDHAHIINYFIRRD